MDLKHAQRMSLLVTTNKFGSPLDQTAWLKAYHDPVIFKDERVFKTLLVKESKYLPCSQRYSSNSSIQPDMRKEVADWMLEVCEHESMEKHHPTCPSEVFCLAINYMDRFLGVCPTISTSQLQLLGAVCLMVAWKVREHEPLSAQRLVEYSDETLTIDDIMEWEVLLLSKLDWDMSAVIAFDFVEHIIQRLENMTADQPLAFDANSLRSNAETLITLCTGHHGFSHLSPCLIATACVLVTLKSNPNKDSDLSSSSSHDVTMASLSWSSLSASSDKSIVNDSDFDRLFDLIQTITSLDKESVKSCMVKIEDLMKPNPTQDDSLVQSPSSASEVLTSTPRRRDNS